MTTTETAARLVDNLGPTLVCAMLGRRDRDLVGDPATWEFPDDQMAKLDHAATAWRLVEVADGPDVARVWFTGSNPRLGDRPPVALIREGRGADVVAAAEALASDVGGD